MVKHKRFPLLANHMKWKYIPCVVKCVMNFAINEFNFCLIHLLHINVTDIYDSVG